MKIVVVGGSGLIGTKLVHRLRMHGHETIAASPSSGVDSITGAGLASVLADTQVVVDVTNSPSPDDTMALKFFETSTRNLLAAEAVAKVEHHIVLSIVGADRLSDSGYMRAKIAQENLVRTSAVPFTILRATQFFEFLGVIARASTDQDTVRLSPAFVQPVAADDVAEALADVAVGAPANSTVELAGPERFRLDELVQRYLSAIQDPRQVKTDTYARYFGAQLDERSLTPSDNPRIGSTRFEQWLDREGGVPPVNS
jgi:uncharacterized protein YbjT (DUF2867 family)